LAKLVANGSTGKPYFGSSVAINSAGDKIIVGDINDNIKGAVWVFVFDGNIFF
jgi:hypothetical protein